MKEIEMQLGTLCSISVLAKRKRHKKDPPRHNFVNISVLAKSRYPGTHRTKVIQYKSRGEVSPIEQDTIECVYLALYLKSAIIDTLPSSLLSFYYIKSSIFDPPPPTETT